MPVPPLPPLPSADVLPVVMLPVDSRCTVELMPTSTATPPEELVIALSPSETIAPPMVTLALAPSWIARPMPCSVIDEPAAVVTVTPVLPNPSIGFDVSPDSVPIDPVAPSVSTSPLPTEMPWPLVPVALIVPSMT